MSRPWVADIAHDMVTTPRTPSAASVPVAVILVLVMGLLGGCSQGDGSGSGSGGSAREAVAVRLNQMQVAGSHNSYHVEPSAEALEIYGRVTTRARELAYTHSPIATQLTEEGVRQLELDIHPDPAGDAYGPAGEPGFKVFHIERIDTGTTCATLVDCLGEIRTWSDANRMHMPIAVLLEVKDQPEFPGGTAPPTMTPGLYDELDTQIRSVFSEDRLLTPDDVRGEHATLEEAVLGEGWPLIDDVRGRVMFLLDNKRDEYLDGHPSLEGRVAFTPSEPGQPDAAFVKVNDPRGENLAKIEDLVTRGYMVRTRADDPVITPTNGDTGQRDDALASGAQWVSTDYPLPGMATRWGDSTYSMQIPGGRPARCNPLNAPEGCQSIDIEDLGSDGSTPSTG